MTNFLIYCLVAFFAGLLTRAIPAWMRLRRQRTPDAKGQLPNGEWVLPKNIGPDTIHPARPDWENNEIVERLIQRGECPWSGRPIRPAKSLREYNERMLAVRK